MSFLVKFKEEVNVSDLHQMKPQILMLLVEFFQYCKKHNLPCTITSLKTDTAPNRKSLTHLEGRAFDASVIGWNKSDCLDCEAYFNTYFGNIGTSPDGKNPKACVFHDAGTGNHLHFQIKRS